MAIYYFCKKVFNNEYYNNYWNEDENRFNRKLGFYRGRL